MKPKKQGFCCAPPTGKSLLDLALEGQHAYSHWRTVSRRLPYIDSIFKNGLRCAVDKYMGYRLEELGPGMFVNKVCYKYREGVKGSISSSFKTKRSWQEIKVEALQRRLNNNIKPFPITASDGLPESICRSCEKNVSS